MEDTYPCDFSDCTVENANRVMMVGEDPVAVLCDKHEAMIQEDPSKKVSLDVHYHRHTVVSLVDTDAPSNVIEFPMQQSNGIIH